MEKPGLDASTNILGGINLCRAAIDSGCQRFIYINTGGALYGHPVYSPSDEAHPIRPISAYGLSKWTMECYVRMLLPSTMPVTVLRLANIYGPRQDPDGEAGVISIFGKRMLRGEPVTIYGDGAQTRDFLYVDDVVRAHEFALRSFRSATVNISSGKALSVNELFDVMARETGYSLDPIRQPERNGEIKHVVLDNRRASRLMAWEPEVPLGQGLPRTLKWLGNGGGARG
jgi:UDP-glucose 4-epimerase